MLGRTNPVGVLVSALGLSAMLVGAEAAQRESGLPVSLMQTIQALIVVFVVAGDALSARVRAWRGEVVALAPARGGSALEMP